MRKPSCKATTKTLKEVQAMSPGEVDEILITAPIKVREAIAAVILAIPKAVDEELDDWECDLADILFTEIK